VIFASLREYKEMLYEERTYTLYPGCVPAFLDAYEGRGMHIHRRHLGEQLAIFTTDVGTLNQIVQIFAFTDAGDRQRRREALYLDPEWLEFTPVFREFIVRMESRLLVPTRLSKLH
jgi:hypothetical protein